MSRVGVTTLAALRKHRRWDVEFFLGDPSHPERVQRAQKRVADAQKTLDAALADGLAEEQRVREMQQSGDVITPWWA